MISSYLIDWNSIQSRISELDLDLMGLLSLKDALKNLRFSIKDDENGFLLKDRYNKVTESLNAIIDTINNLIGNNSIKDALDGVLFEIKTLLDCYQNDYDNKSVRFPSPDFHTEPQEISTWLSLCNAHFNNITRGKGSIAAILIYAPPLDAVPELTTPSPMQGHFNKACIDWYKSDDVQETLDCEIERKNWKKPTEYRYGDEKKFLRFINSYSISSSAFSENTENTVTLIDPYFKWFICPKVLVDTPHQRPEHLKEDSQKKDAEPDKETTPQRRKNSQLNSLKMILRPFVHNEDISNIRIIIENPRSDSNRKKASFNNNSYDSKYYNAMSFDESLLDTSSFNNLLKDLCSKRKNALTVSIIFSDDDHSDEELHNRYIENNLYCISFQHGLEICTSDSRLVFPDKKFRVGYDANIIPGEFRDCGKIKPLIWQYPE